MKMDPRGLAKLLYAVLIGVFAMPAFAYDDVGPTCGAMDTASYLRNIVSGSKSDPKLYYQRGLESLIAGEYGHAEREFRRVLKIAPNHGVTLYQLGMVQEAQQEFKAARRSYKKAVRADRKLYDARLRLALVSLQLDERDAAEEELATLKEAAVRCAGQCPAEEIAQIKSAVEDLSDGLNAPAVTAVRTAPVQKTAARGSAPAT